MLLRAYSVLSWGSLESRAVPIILRAVPIILGVLCDFISENLTLLSVSCFMVYESN